MRRHDRTLRHRPRPRPHQGPKDDGPRTLEHLAGWTLVVVVAMLMTQLGLL
ncbi:SCO1431 family membrane protein [Streptomyces longwoodensis]|uniref:SCO1431 family membrane protein n=1 Tax=Streptomyces longwoodensis TaxID=68231 RepID=UPI003243C07C